MNEEKVKKKKKKKKKKKREKRGETYPYLESPLL